MSRLVKSFGVGQNRRVYGNFQVQSPDGILMFRCDEKRINWYIKRNLANFVDDKTIRLNFQPKGLGNHERVFGLSQMKNHCVVCGTKNYLTRHHVIPTCYRKWFPLTLKSHNFHDVLLMCVDCHDSYERKADELKQKLSKEYSAPINGEYEYDSELIKLAKMASTLLNKDLTMIPKERVDFMRQHLRGYFNYSRLTKKRLHNISKIKSKKINKSHGQIVVENLVDYQKFIELWRSHFLNQTEANYLPDGWDVKTKITYEV